MRGVFWIACVSLLVASLLFSSACPAADGPKSWTAAPPKAAAAKEAAKAAPAPEKGERLGFLERRRLGLTVAKVRPVVEKLLAEGKIDRDNPSAAAAAVMHELVAQDPKAWGDVEANWDGILEFLEKLIPLIMKLIDLFSWSPAILPSYDLAAPPILAMTPAWQLAA